MADETPNSPAGGVPIYDISSKVPVLGTIAPHEVTQAVSSGSFSLPKGQPVPVVSPDGTLGTISPEEAPQAFQNGYRFQTPDDALQGKYGSPGQQLLTGAEGALEAATFGLSTGIEKDFGVPTEDIRGRRAANPVSHGIGQGAGLLASAFIPGLGEAKALQVAGEGTLAAKAAKVINPLSAQSVMTGLAEKAAAKMGLGGPGIGSQIAASAIKGGIETALFQGGDEISKMLSEDPNQSLGSAAANIGLAGLIGGGISGSVGSVSPLWEATVGPKLGNFVSDFSGRIREHLSGVEAPVSDTLSLGQKIADAFVKKGVGKILGEDLGTTIGATAGSMFGHPALGALLGKNTLAPFFESILPSLIKPVLENGASSGAFKAAVDYGMAVVRGEALVNRAAKAVFTMGQEVLPSHALPSEKERKELTDLLDQSQVDPESLMRAGGSLGTYMPMQASTLGKTAAVATQYLNSQRPVTSKNSPLDADPVVSIPQKKEFENTLNMAQQPLLALEKMKTGTLSPKDVVTVKTIYPGLYQSLTQKLTNQLIEHASNGGSVPYHTRMSLSLFLGQPLDSTMTPQSLQTLQAQFTMPQKGEQANQNIPQGRHSTASLSKSAQRYMTAGQAAQARHNEPN